MYLIFRFTVLRKLRKLNTCWQNFKHGKRLFLAAQCLAGLVKGLRPASKQQHANSCLSTSLEKFKEKKLYVVTYLKKCVVAIYLILGVEAIPEDCSAALKLKTTPVRSEIASYEARCFAKCPPVLATNKKMSRTLL